jgi:hypothetical protein
VAGSLKHLMRPEQERRGACDAERLCRPEIEDQLALSGSLDGVICQRGALQPIAWTGHRNP